MHGDTLSDDKFEGETFNYQLTNPPYGKEWKKEKKAVLEEAKLGFKGRFGAGLPAISDGSMLFIQNVAAKLAPIEQGGGKAAIVLSGSPLFNGDAGSGPSNIRRWLFEKDYIDCIVKLPTEIFFRTGISTYIWILSNKKPEGRRGMIQLIDASDKRVPLKRNLGNKRYEISDEQIGSPAPISTGMTTATASSCPPANSCTAKSPRGVPCSCTSPSTSRGPMTCSSPPSP